MTGVRPPCERCDSPHFARGLCRRHYDQDYQRRNTHRPDRPLEPRLLKTRARNQAVKQLVARHRAEFDELCSLALNTVREEAALIAATVEQAGLSTGMVRLRSGPRSGDETLLDRIREDVGRCEVCWGHHDADHVCPRCNGAAGQPPSAERQIEALLRCGRSAAWIAANTGEPMPAVLRVLDRMRREAAQRGAP